MKIRTNYVILIIVILGMNFLSVYPNFLNPTSGELLFGFIFDYFILCLYADIRVSDTHLIIKYPFRFWSPIHKIPLTNISSVEASGGRTENLFVYKRSKGKEIKEVFEFYTFRYRGLKKFATALNDLLESRQTEETF